MLAILMIPCLISQRKTSPGKEVESSQHSTPQLCPGPDQGWGWRAREEVTAFLERQDIQQGPWDLIRGRRQESRVGPEGLRGGLEWCSGRSMARTGS